MQLIIELLYDLSKVTRVVFIHQYSMMMLTSSISSTSRMRSMLSYTTVSSKYVPSLLPIFMEGSRLQNNANMEILHFITNIKGTKYLNIFTILLFVCQKGYLFNFRMELCDDTYDTSNISTEQNGNHPNRRGDLPQTHCAYK